MTHGAGQIRRIRHVTRGQRVAVPVGRGVAEAAVIRRHHVARGVIGRPSLQGGAGRAHVERQTRLVTGVAARGREGMLGLGHVHRPEGADRIGARRMAGAAIGSRQIRNVCWREYRVLGREVVVPDQSGGGAMALSAVSGDTGVQDGICCERRRRVVARRGGMTHGAGLIGGIWHMTRGQSAAVPVGRGVAAAAVAGQHRAGGMIGGAQLQPWARGTHVETHRGGSVAGIAGGGHDGMGGLGHVHRPETADRVRARGVAGAAIGSREIRDVRGGEHCIFGIVVVVVEGELAGGAMALSAAVADAGMQYRICRERGVIGRRRGVTGIAGLVRRVWHVACGQGAAVPVGRGVAEAAVVRCHHVAGGVIGGAALQCRVGRAHVEGKAGFVAAAAGRSHASVRGLRHVHGAEPAGDVIGRVTGTAILAGEGRYMRRRQRCRGLGVVVVVVERQLRCAAVALGAAAGDAGVQNRNAGQRGVAIDIARHNGRVAHGAGLGARDRHVAVRQRRRRGPVGGGVTERAVTRRLAGRVGCGDMSRGPLLQRRAAACVVGRDRVMAGVARRRHEGVLGGTHRRGRAESARDVVRRVA